MAGYEHREYQPDGTYWVSRRHDDDARTVTTYDAIGNVTATRPYTADENAAADAAAVALAHGKNTETIRDRAALALESNAEFLALAAPTNAQSLTQIRRLTRQVQGLIRLELRALDTADDT